MDGAFPQMCACVLGHRFVQYCCPVPAVGIHYAEQRSIGGEIDVRNHCLPYVEIVCAAYTSAKLASSTCASEKQL